eukprot:GHRR01008505.1.p2 GENE.GHRR01008505.1~~GHRR01008505.1.p2  ORF type:complete len:390 (+),score=185.89 GHRR01008505.1:720-1889(+)
MTCIYSAEPCPDARKSDKCARGDLCPYSHGVFEQWLHPSRYRTQLCSFGTACKRPVCFFAHTVQELRVPTACGPAATPLGTPAALAAGLIDPNTAGKDNGYLTLVQQALLAQMHQAAHSVDGATATMINQYQAASCAALANAAAYQRQQHHHQAAAAAAAAAAMAAAAHNPASLLHMAQAAQAYQAAAAAAAAAAANVPVPPMNSIDPINVLASSTQSSGSDLSSPTCSSSNNNSSLASVSTLVDAQDRAACGLLPSTSSAAVGSLFDSLLLQQALATAAGNNSTWSSPTNAGSAFASPACNLPPAPSASSPLDWLPATSTGVVADVLGPSLTEAALARVNNSYPTALMPHTPGIVEPCHVSAAIGASSSLDVLTNQLTCQLSMQAYTG